MEEPTAISPQVISIIMLVSMIWGLMRLEIWHWIVISITKHQQFSPDFLLLLRLLLHNTGMSNMKRNFILLHKTFMSTQEKAVSVFNKQIFSTLEWWLSSKINMKSFFFSEIFCSWNVAAFSLFSTYSKLLFPFICTTLTPMSAIFKENMCDIWAWHSVNRQAIIGTGLSAVCLMPCLLWKSPRNRCSKYSYWSRGRGPTMM